MQIKEKLKALFDKQKENLNEYEKIVKEFEESDIVNQNEELHKELIDTKTLLEELREKHKKIQSENQNLRTALQEQVLDEKLNILKISKNKINTYFMTCSGEYANELVALEESVKNQINRLKSIASQELGSNGMQFQGKLDQLSQELNTQITSNREKFVAQKRSITDDLNQKAEHLAEEGVSEEVLQKRIKNNNIEIKIGLSWVNKIGILLILIGVAAFMQYSYVNWFAPYMKGIFAFVIGGIFLIAGEIFNKKDRDVFAKGLTGGGIAILYYAIFNAYFVFNLFGIGTGIMLSILVTLTSLVLSLHHNSKTICGFSLIGGYFPFFTYVFAFGLSASSIYIAMGYLLILNLLILIISIYKDWNVTSYISFLLNVPSLIYLVFAADSTTVGIIYSVLTFAMYLIITLIYPFKNKIGLKTPDVILLALNTFTSCIIIYSLFDKANLGDLNGLLALLFCLIYFSLGQFITKFMSAERFTGVLFYLTSLTFAILIIPFQFGMEWLAMGWFVEGSLMIIYGYKNKFKNLENAGWVVFLLCLWSFIFVDAINMFGIPDEKYFDFKYLVITIGTIAILFMYLIDINKNLIAKYSTKGQLITLFKVFTIINFWIYACYTSNMLYDKFLKDADISYMFRDYYSTVLFAVITIITGFIISSIPLLKDKFAKGFSIFLYILGDIICIFLTLNTPTLAYNASDNTALHYFAFIILLLFNIFVFFNIRSLIIMFITDGHSSLEYYPIVMAIYLLGSIIGFLTVQFNIERMNLMFSILYIALAFLYIVYGFMQRYIYIRRFGLGLTVFAIGKLFIYDLSYLDTVGRIIAYFSFGIIMLGISLVYQKISNALEEKYK